MSRRHPALFLLTLLALCLPFAHAAEPTSNLASAEKTTQYWGRAFWPSQNPETAGGLAIELMNVVTKRLPEYQHQYQIMSFSRGFNDLQHRNDLCMVGVVRAEQRDRSGYFVGLWPLLPPQLLIRRDSWQQISGGQPTVSMQALLQRPDLHGASIQQRTFGGQVDQLLTPSNNLELLQTSSKTNNLLQMLAKKRIDFTPEYIEVFLDNTQEQLPLREQLMALSIAEAQTPAVIGIYCSRSPEGERLTRQIAHIAGDSAVQAEFQNIINREIPAINRQAHQDWLDDFFRNGTKNIQTNLPANAP